jgi:UDP-glucose 4-epimerase
LDTGYKCTVYDNLSSGLRKNLFSEAEFILGDIQDYPLLLETLNTAKNAPFDALIHLASFKAAGESMLKPEKYSHNNIAGTINVLNAVCSNKIKNIVFSSSAAIYGNPEYLPIDEKHPTKPENYYGFTKIEIERILHWYEKLKGIRFASLRYFNAAGYDIKGRIKGLEQNPANLIPVIMETACGMRSNLQIFGEDYDTPDGTCIRDYIHVSDLASAHVMALDYINREDKSLVLNLGSENGASVKEVIETARKITGKPIPAMIVGRRIGDPAILTASAALAKKMLGWEARYSDMETLIKTSWDVYASMS